MEKRSDPQFETKDEQPAAERKKWHKPELHLLPVELTEGSGGTAYDGATFS